MPSKTVSTRYIATTITVPAGTTAAVPQITNLSVGSVVIDAVEIRIPPGHMGVTGIALEFSGTRIVPWTDTTAWIIGNDDLLAFDVDLEVSVPVQVKAYNTGGFDHTFYLRIRTSDIVLPTAPAYASIIPIGA